MWHVALLHSKNGHCGQSFAQVPSVDVCVGKVWVPRYRGDRCHRNTQVGACAKQKVLGEQDEKQTTRTSLAKTILTLVVACAQFESEWQLSYGCNGVPYVFNKK